MKSFFIFGYFGWWNAGDDSIGYIILKELSSRFPSAKLSVTVNDSYFIPKNLMDRVNIINFEPLVILREIRKSTFFIIAGGTHLHDQDKKLFRRFQLFLLFVLLTIYCRLINKKPILLGHGIGPISTRWARLFTKIILKNSRLICVRDFDTYNIVQSFGFKKSSILGFDCSALLTLRSSIDVSINNEFVLGVSIIPVYGIYFNENSKDGLFAKKLADCLNKGLNKNANIKIKIFAFRVGDKHSDVDIIKKLMENIRYDTRIELVLYDGHPENLLKEVSKCDGFIGMRYHSSMFAYLSGIPFIVINYLGKCNSFARYVKLPSNAIISLEDVFSGKLCEILSQFIEEPDKFKANMPTAKALQLVKKMFDGLEDLHD